MLPYIDQFTFKRTTYVVRRTSYVVRVSQKPWYNHSSYCILCHLFNVNFIYIYTIYGYILRILISLYLYFSVLYYKYVLYVRYTLYKVHCAICILLCTMYMVHVQCALEEWCSPLLNITQILVLCDMCYLISYLLCQIGSLPTHAYVWNQIIMRINNK